MWLLRWSPLSQKFSVDIGTESLPFSGKKWLTSYAVNRDGIVLWRDAIVAMYPNFPDWPSNCRYGRNRVSKRRLTSVLSPALPKVKKRPRGRPFEPGNTLSLPYRFKPGQSGNPGGRPKSKEINESSRKFLASDIGKSPRVQTNAELIVAKIGHRAKKGDLNAAVFLAERAEGRPAMCVNVDGSGDNLTLILNAMDEVSREIGPPEGMVRKQLAGVTDVKAAQKE
jgi:hypothetical protein